MKKGCRVFGMERLVVAYLFMHARGARGSGRLQQCGFHLFQVLASLCAFATACVFEFTYGTMWLHPSLMIQQFFLLASFLTPVV